MPRVWDLRPSRRARAQSRLHGAVLAYAEPPASRQPRGPRPARQGRDLVSRRSCPATVLAHPWPDPSSKPGFLAQHAARAIVSWERLAPHRFADRGDVAFAVEGWTGWRYAAGELAAASPGSVLAAALFGLQTERPGQLAQAVVAVPLRQRGRQLQ